MSKTALAHTYKMSLRVITCSLANIFWIASTSAQFSSTGAEQISIGLGTSAPDGFSSDPVAPPNGDVVVFSSRASNLVTNDTNGLSDVFQRTPERGIELVSVSEVTGTFPGPSPSGLGATAPAVSNILPDGSYAVAFLSESTDIIPAYQPPLQGQANPRQVYLRIPKLNKTILISLSIASTQGIIRGADNDCDQISVVALANPTRYLIAFRSAASNLRQTVPAPIPKKLVFVTSVSLATGAPVIELVEAADRLPTGQPVDADLNHPVLSGDGRFVAFSSRASFGGSGSANGKEQVWLFDRSTKQLTLISVTPQGVAGNDDSSKPSLSFRGDFIGYLSKATDIIPRSSALPIAILANIPRREFSQINTARDGSSSNGAAYAVMLSPSAKLAVFSDDGSNLAPGSTNGVIQTYMKDLSSGAVVRASETAGGTAGDGNSGAPPQSPGEPFGGGTALAFGATGFSSSLVFTLFRSAAQNLTQVGLSSDSSPNIFRCTLTPPKPRFRNKSRIETPPDIAIRSRLPGARGASVVLTFQDFDTETEAVLGEALEATAEASRTARLQYRVEIRKSDSKKRIFRAVTRNTTTIRKLTPGRYTVRYRVTRTVGSSTTKSRYSPRASVEIS